MATVKEIIEKAYTKVNGEYEAIAESSDDFKTYLSVMNNIIGEWADTPFVKWQSLYDINYLLPTQVAAGVKNYAVPDAVVIGNTPLDSIYFVDETGLTVKTYKMTDQALFEASTNTEIAAYLGGEIWLKTVPDELVGTSIRLPAYVKPPVYTTGSQQVKIDSVSWLYIAMAAAIADSSPVPFIARNAEKFSKEAEKYMQTMRRNNKHRQHLTIKKSTGSATNHTWDDVMNVATIRDL